MKQNQNSAIEEQTQIYEARISQMKVDHEYSIKKLSSEVEDLTKQLNDIQT